LVIFGYLLFATLAQKNTPNEDDYDGKRYMLTTPGQADKQQNHSAQGKTYYLTSAHSEKTQEKGLSGTPRLASNQGKLFWYDQMGERCFWMKDMRYSLDIVWLDDHKKVVHVEKNLSPKTYPKAYCVDAQYAIELAAGEADKSGLSLGQVLSF
jgi:uncharacterized membrane protein (UPF0127 family)